VTPAPCLDPKCLACQDGRPELCLRRVTPLELILRCQRVERLEPGAGVDLAEGVRVYLRAERAGIEAPAVVIELEESDRQLTLMALARLAVVHPGFGAALELLALRLEGRLMFDEFKAFAPKVPQ
jgi:hypothetical protein